MPSADGRVPESVVRFELFGPLQITTASRRFGPKDFASRKAKQMCEVLAIAAGHPVSKDHVIEVLWEHRMPQHPRSALDHLASQIRSVLVADDGSPAIVTERGMYRIDLSVADIDIVRFDRIIDGTTGESRASAVPFLLRAAELARGAILEDEMYAPWVETVRERYRQRVERLLLDIARGALVCDDELLALRMADRARLQSPVVLEEAFALGIAALIRLGRRSEARSLMLELERRMGSELGADIAPETLMLRSMLSKTGAGGIRSVEVAAVARGSLPDVLPFVGRQQEIAEVDAAIERIQRGANELVIVEGPPGIGKSRLLNEIELAHVPMVHSYSCLPSDSDHSLYTVFSLLRSLTNATGLARPLDLTDSVTEVFGRLADLIEEIGPVVIAIDDIQWADEASITVLAGLARPRVARSVVVIAARTLAGHSVDAGRDRLARVRHRRIELRPLERTAVEELPFAAAWTETGGHPGLLAACLEACRLDGRLSFPAVGDVLAWVGPPESSARLTLSAASSLQPRFQAGEVAELLGLSRATTIDLLMESARQHHLRCTDPGSEVFEFQAQLTRRVLRHTAKRKLPWG